MFKILTQDGRARRGEYTTAHGTVQTPVFMNVGTAAAIKGGLSATLRRQIGVDIGGACGQLRASYLEEKC